MVLPHGQTWVKMFFAQSAILLGITTVRISPQFSSFLLDVGVSALTSVTFWLGCFKTARLLARDWPFNSSVPSGASVFLIFPRLKTNIIGHRSCRVHNNYLNQRLVCGLGHFLNIKSGGYNRHRNKRIWFLMGHQRSLGTKG